MYVYTHVYVYIYIYICICTYMYIYILFTRMTLKQNKTTCAYVHESCFAEWVMSLIRALIRMSHFTHVHESFQKINESYHDIFC